MAPTAHRTHIASLMLMLATAAWAVSFTLGKDGGDRLNQLSGAGTGAFFGPVALQGIRFIAAAVVWFAIFPMARRGWTLRGLWRGTYAGLLLAAGIMLQHLALDRTTPAATAFLTALTVLWVPAILCAARRRLPAYPLLFGVVLAAGGLYFMLGEGFTSFRAGEMLGLACSMLFALHLLAVSHVVRKENAWRMGGAQFVICGLFCLIPAMLYQQTGPIALLQMAADPPILWRLGVLLVFPTLLAFGLMNFYQPSVDPTRATLIYQAEPAMAAGADFLLTGRGLNPIEMLGAGLIIAANLVAELMPATRREQALNSENPTLPLPAEANP